MSPEHLHNEKQLLVDLAAGSEEAFTTVFRTYYPVLFAHAVRYLKADYWAEEIVQEVFTSVWNDREKIRAVENLGGWLHRMTWNKSVDRIRRNQSQHKVQYALQFLNVQEADDTSANYREKMYLLLEAAVNDLSSQRRTIYHLRYHDKLSLEEIAQKLGLSRNTVRNHMSLALENIRTHILKHGDLYVVCWIFYHYL